MPSNRVGGKAARSKGKKEAAVFVKIFVALGALWAMGFFLFNFVKVLMGRRVF
jgi:uncharacterized membrane protein YuzA (DUF378 family)